MKGRSGSSSAGGASRWGRCVRAPLRVLCGMRDLYVKGMNGCADRVQCGAAVIAYPSYSAVGRSSFGSGRSSASDEDLRELVRAATSMRGQAKAVGRSQSVVVGRIDEDAPCEFRDDVRLGSDLLFPRCRSAYAVGVGVKRRAKVFAD